MTKFSEKGFKVYKQGDTLCFTCANCQRPLWTIIRDEGIAMQRVLCRIPDCNGIAHFNPGVTNTAIYSSFPPKPTHEWYRMSRFEARRLDKQYPGTFEYHKEGGLGLRVINANT